MLTFELVIPAYNEEKNIELLVETVQAALMESQMDVASFRLKLVNNGSFDGTADVLAAIQQKKIYPWLDVVHVEKNQGYGFGIWSGLQKTSATYVGWTHADLQCDPRNAFKALKQILASSAPEKTLVKGVRSGRDWKDRMVSRVFEFFAYILLGCPVYEINAQPKVFHRSLLSEMTHPPQTFALDLYAIYHAKKMGMVIQTIPVLFPPRIHGTSKWASHFVSRYKTILGMIRYMWSLRQKEGSL